MIVHKTHVPFHDPCTGKAKNLIADQNVRWSSGSTWHGVMVESYIFDKVDTPEFQTVNHNLVLHLSVPTRVDLTADGKKDNRIRASGDLAFLPAGTICKVNASEPHEILMISISQQLMNNCAAELRDNWPSGPGIQTYLVDTQLEHIAKAFKAEAESNFISGPLYGESLARAFASRLLNRYSDRSSPSSRTGGLAPQALRRVVNLIESDLASPLRLDSLAAAAGLSPCRFAHNFKVQTGLPPHRYLMQARIERAKRMLRETSLPIVEVALSVGLQSSSQFNSLFKREMGTTPSTFRSYFR